MLTRTLLSVLIVTLLAAHAHAQTPEPPRQSSQGQPDKSKTVGTKGTTDVEDTTNPVILAYNKKVRLAVFARWNFQVKKKLDELKPGKVKVLIMIDATGKLKNLSVTENTSDDALAKLVEKCVRETEFAPPPPEALRNGVFEYPMSFHLL